MIIKFLFLKIRTIDPNYRIEKFTILSFACEKNDIEIIQFLLLDKIDVNSVSCDGNTHLLNVQIITSINNKNLEIAELWKTNINKQNYQEQTALIICTSSSFT